MARAGRVGVGLEQDDYLVVLVGQLGVGKSSLLIRFVEGRFYKNFEPSLQEDFAEKLIEVGNQSCDLKLMDTSESLGMRDLSYLKGDGFLICFSLSSPFSLKEEIHFIESILRCKSCEPNKLPIILVGTKSDLSKGDASLSEKELEANSLASQFDCPFLYTSSKEDLNVDEAFEMLVKEIRRKKRLYGEKTIEKKRRCVLQ